MSTRTIIYIAIYAIGLAGVAETIKFYSASEHGTGTFIALTMTTCAIWYFLGRWTMEEEMEDRQEDRELRYRHDHG